MKYYATGTKRVKNKTTGEVAVKQYRIPIAAEDRIGAVNEANRKARREGITVDAILPVANHKYSKA
ncbi:hypothetical protein D3C72_886080 [compost metagenome]